MNKRKQMTLAIVVFTPILYGCIAFSIPTSTHWTIIVVFTWLASPILFLSFALLYEQGVNGRGLTFGEVVRSVFSPKTQSWAFIFGDILLLPAAAVTATFAWDAPEYDGRHPSIFWGFVCFVIGYLVGHGFHAMDGGAYRKLGHEQSMHSATKRWHDLGTYPILFGALLFGAGPLLVEPAGWDSFDWTWHLNAYTITILVLIVGWAVLGGVCDRKRGAKLVPWGHPRTDPRTGALLP